MTNPSIVTLLETPKLRERILDKLDFTSICSFRLVCRALREIVASSRLWQQFTHMRVELSSDLDGSKHAGLNTLAKYAALTHGKLVTHLTVVATVYDQSSLKGMIDTRVRHEIKPSGIIVGTTTVQLTDDDVRDLNEELDWMQRCERDQDKSDDLGLVEKLGECLGMLSSLKVLDFSAAVIRRRGDRPLPPICCRGWPLVSSRVSRVFGIVMSSIVESGVELEALNFMHDTEQCAVPLQSILDCQQSLRARGVLASNLRSVTRFALSVAVMGDQGDGSHADAVADLLAMMPNLESLRLHFYGQKGAKSSSDLMSKSFHPIGQRTHLPSLRRCSLQGMPSSPDILTSFITRHNSISHLDLSDMYMDQVNDEGWSKTLTKLVDVLRPSLEFLRLSDLRGPEFHDVAPINIDPLAGHEVEERRKRAMSWSLPYGGGRRQWHTIELGRAGLEHGSLVFGRPSAGNRPLGSPQAYRWMMKNRMKWLPAPLE